MFARGCEWVTVPLCLPHDGPGPTQNAPCLLHTPWLWPQLEWALDRWTKCPLLCGRIPLLTFCPRMSAKVLWIKMFTKHQIAMYWNDWGLITQNNSAICYTCRTEERQSLLSLCHYIIIFSNNFSFVHQNLKKSPLSLFLLLTIIRNRLFVIVFD